MSFEVKILFPGFSGRLSNGRLGWGTTALIQDGIHNILMDCGGMAVRQTLRGMLAGHGLDCSDIDVVLLSHLHADHVHNLDFFPQARFVLSLAEWEAGSDLCSRDYSVGENAIPLLRSFRKTLVTGDNTEVYPGITAMLTPGHTLGSTSYLLHQPHGQAWLLAGDAVKNRCELRDEVVQQTVDLGMSLASIRRIKKAASRVLPGHDGWLALRDGEVIPEGGNDIVMEFGEGLLVNGQRSLTLQMGWTPQEQAAWLPHPAPAESIK